jgi:hypothetical protein
MIYVSARKVAHLSSQWRFQLRKRRRPENGWKFIFLTVAALLVLGAAGPVWALYANYNRFEPLMDYVPQRIGIYDTMYWELSESDCQDCHSDYHYAESCLTPGCHNWEHDIVNPEGNGLWHHNRVESANRNCVYCHDSTVEAYTPPVSFEDDPPPFLTPKPFSCDNCHWEQALSGAEDPDYLQHPSEYDSQGGEFIEHSKAIYGSFDTHHMGFQGNVTSECDTCHGPDPDSPDWNPYDPALIRLCETCHSRETLHRIHTQDYDGWRWQAVGFHTSAEAPGDPCADVDPTMHGDFTSNEICGGCHVITNIPEPPPPPRRRPAIDATIAGIQPNHASCGAMVTLRGKRFGAEHTAGYRVQMKLQYSDNPWVDVPVHLWTKTLIAFEVPCWTLPPGNYKVRVVTPTGKCNSVFALEGLMSVASVDPEASSYGERITISGVGFGNVQAEVYANGYNGVHRVVDFISPDGIYTALDYKSWGDTSIKVTLCNVFQDNVDLEKHERNFTQNDGSSDSCPEEPTECINLQQGIYSVCVKAIYFGDEDASGGLSCGDTIFQVVASDVVTGDPMQPAPMPDANIRIAGNEEDGTSGCFIGTAAHGQEKTSTLKWGALKIE